MTPSRAEADAAGAAAAAAATQADSTHLTDSTELAPGLTELARLLGEEPRARVPLERCRALLASLPGGPPGGDPDPRRVLLDALTALARAGVLRLPAVASSTGWDRERRPALPRWVLVPRARRQPSTTPADLHTLLARARDRAVGVRLPADVAVLDAWLKAQALTAPELPVAERSFEIFGDEKRLDAFLRTRFAVQGGLVAATFRAYRVVEPFAMTPFDPTSCWALALENLASYDSVCRVVSSLPPEATRPAAVIFGRGTQFTLSCESLPTRLPTVRQLVYLGDLDATGLEIPLSARATLSTSDVQVVPWEAAYASMLARPSRPVSAAPRPAELERLVQFLPSPLREPARTLLRAPARVPQESVTRTELARLVAELETSKRAEADTLQTSKRQSKLESCP